MRALIVVFILILSGCLQTGLMDYPGGPKDIAKANAAIEKRMKELNSQQIIAEKHEKAKWEVLERQSEEYNLAAAKREQEEKAKREENQKFWKAKRENDRKCNESIFSNVDPNGYTNNIEQKLKSKLQKTSITAKCGFNTCENEIHCVLRAPEGNKDPRMLHSVQKVALDAATDLMGTYPIGYSISAQTADDIPLARFIYNYQFDTLTPIIMWN